MIVTLPGRGRVVTEVGASTEAAYRRIASALRRQITAGDLAPGQRIPSESELVAQYSVSRGTARQAVGMLEADGLLTAVHGKGRFVTDVEPS